MRERQSQTLRDISAFEAITRLKNLQWPGIDAWKTVSAVKVSESDPARLYAPSTVVPGFMIIVSEKAFPITQGPCDIVEFVGLDEDDLPVEAVRLAVGLNAYFVMQNEGLAGKLSIAFEMSRHSACNEYRIQRGQLLCPSGGDLEIRSYGKEDYDAFYDVIQSEGVRRFFSPHMSVATLCRAFVGFREKEPTTIVYIAESRGNPKPSMEIFGLWTTESHRGKGYGKRIAYAAAEYALLQKDYAYYLVDDQNVASIRIAEALGFKLNHRSTNYVGRTRRTH